MKVFIPMSDALLTDKGEMTGTPVPFDPVFLQLEVQIGEAEKPANWIPETDFSSTYRRLREAGTASQSENAA